DSRPDRARDRGPRGCRRTCQRRRARHRDRRGATLQGRGGRGFRGAAGRRDRRRAPGPDRARRLHAHPLGRLRGALPRGMLNVHPSLLPAYRGLHTHRRVLAAAARAHGASVHYVTPELDAGPVVLQSRVPVRAGDTEAALAARVLRTEHVIYPRVIGWVAAGRLRWHDGAAWLDGARLDQPIVEEFSAADT